MKRLIAATVIMLSSCTAYADYATTKFCTNLAKLATELRIHAIKNKLTDDEVFHNTILQGQQMNAGKAIIAAAFAATDNPSYTTPRDWYMAAGEACLEVKKVANEYGNENVMVFHRAKDFYNHKGW